MIFVPNDPAMTARSNTRSCRLAAHETNYKPKERFRPAFPPPSHLFSQTKLKTPLALALDGLGHGQRCPRRRDRPARRRHFFLSFRSIPCSNFVEHALDPGLVSFLLFFSKSKSRNPLCNVVFSYCSCLLGQWPYRYLWTQAVVCIFC